MTAANSSSISDGAAALVLMRRSEAERRGARARARICAHTSHAQAPAWFATAPVAGQNVGAGLADRVRETFRSAAWIGSGLMLSLTLLCQWHPALLIRGFTSEPEVVAIGAGFLKIISWNFVASGLIFTCSGMFQALANTWPSVLSSGTRLLTFVLPAIWLSRQPSFELRHLWILSVLSVGLHAATSLWLLRGELRRRLVPTPET